MSSKIQGDNIYGDKLIGDKVLGDKVLGDKYVTNYYEASKPDPQKALEIAKYQFQQLPINKIPDPDPDSLSEDSRILLSYNPYFVGRREAFQAIAASLKNDDVLVVTGIAGVGKTQLAAEFAHRYGRYFLAGVYWLSFADPAAIPAEIAACGRNMELPGLYTFDIDTQVKMVLSEWEEPPPRLLIFDNCEDEKLFNQYWPKYGGARVLVTSRRGRWSPGFGIKTLPLNQLTRAESVQFLQQIFQPITNNQASEIANALGDLPLALHLAGSYLAYYEGIITPKKFLAELENAGPFHEALVGEFEGVSPTGHERNLACTFQFSYERLMNSGFPLAHEILMNLTYLAPGETVPYDLLLATFGQEDERTNEKEIIVARHLLVSLGLVTSEGNLTLRIHRLFHHFVRQFVGEKSWQESLLRVEKTVFENAQILIEAGYPGPLLAWQYHLRYMTDNALTRQDEQSATMAGIIGYHLMDVADYGGAKPYLEQALTIRENVLGENHLDVAAILNILGMLFQAMDKLLKAQLCYERALHIREQILGSDHHDTATCLNNLGTLYRAMGDFPRAKPLYERALAIDKKVLGTNHPDTAISLNNIGTLLRDMGELKEARPYFEQALVIWEQTQGDNHPYIAYSLTNLGHLLKDMGDFEGAKQYYDRALAIREEMLGPNHPNTAASLNNLGILMQMKGDFSKAKALFEHALAIFEAKLGTDHPETKSVRDNLESLINA